MTCAESLRFEGEIMRHDMQAGDRVIWVRSPGRSILTGWKVVHIRGIVVRVCNCKIKIKVLLGKQEKTVNVDPENLIHEEEVKAQLN